MLLGLIAAATAAVKVSEVLFATGAVLMAAQPVVDKIKEEMD